MGQHGDPTAGVRHLTSRLAPCVDAASRPEPLTAAASDSLSGEAFRRSGIEPCDGFVVVDPGASTTGAVARLAWLPNGF
jgi:hypothetical protein